MLTMKCSVLASALTLLLAASCSQCTTDAFVPRPSFAAQQNNKLSTSLGAATATTVEVPTKPIQGMKPGTSGLRKKVEVWQAVDEENKNYLENFVQSLLDTAFANNGGNPLDTIIVAGDGRYYNTEAMQIICRILAANNVENIYIPKGGIMSTPAVSAAIRRREGGKPKGGIVLTASHNPGGPGEDFGIKYNEAFGQPAGEEFTDAVSDNRRYSLVYM
jgi:phosphoglucomutase